MLSDEQKRLMLTKRLEQIHLEAYQHELNRLVAVEVGDEQKEAEATAAITILETESNVYVAEITYLDDPSANPSNAEISESSSSVDTVTPLTGPTGTNSTATGPTGSTIGVQGVVDVQADQVVEVTEVE